MNEQEIVTWLLEEKLAGNPYQAQNMGRKLRLHELGSDEEQKDRCRLYREFRRAGENRDAAAIKAIAGQASPALLLSDEPSRATEIKKEYGIPEFVFCGNCLSPRDIYKDNFYLVEKCEHCGDDEYELFGAAVEESWLIPKSIADEPAPLTGLTGDELADYFDGAGE